jgi:hypothetical protein
MNTKDYETARIALSFAETEGGDWTLIQKHRSNIPHYAELASPKGSSRPVDVSDATAKDLRGSAALRLTTTFASSHLRGWDIRAFAAGEDCAVLLITFYVRMDPPMIDALHRGSAIYGQILPGGIREFVAENGFRGVVYRDGYDTTWRYGQVREREVTSLKSCY